MAIHGERSAGRHPRLVRGPHHERTETTHLLLQHADRVVQLVAAEGVAADELRQPIGLMHRRGAYRAHLVQRHRYPGFGRLPGGFGTSQTAANDVDHRLNCT